jgi:hypothetical protein
MYSYIFRLVFIIATILMYFLMPDVIPGLRAETARDRIDPAIAARKT